MVGIFYLDFYNFKLYLIFLLHIHRNLSKLILFGINGTVRFLQVQNELSVSICKYQAKWEKSETCQNPTDLTI